MVFFFPARPLFRGVSPAHEQRCFEVGNLDPVWLVDEAWTEVQKHCKEHNCTKQNEYIEKAIRFYSGYLDTDHVERYLPRVLAGVLDGKSGAPGDRIGRLAVAAPLLFGGRLYGTALTSMQDVWLSRYPFQLTARG